MTKVDYFLDFWLAEFETKIKNHHVMVNRNLKTKVMWIMSIQTDKVIQARMPDIVEKSKELDNMWLINIARLRLGRVKDKEQEKVENYQESAREN